MPNAPSLNRIYNSSEERRSHLPILDEDFIYKHKNGSIESVVYNKDKNNEVYSTLIRRDHNGNDTSQVSYPNRTVREQKTFLPTMVTEAQKATLNDYEFQSNPVLAPGQEVYKTSIDSGKSHASAQSDARRANYAALKAAGFSRDVSDKAKTSNVKTQELLQSSLQ